MTNKAPVPTTFFDTADLSVWKKFRVGNKWTPVGLRSVAVAIPRSKNGEARIHSYGQEVALVKPGRYHIIGASRIIIPSTALKGIYRLVSYSQVDCIIVDKPRGESVIEIWPGRVFYLRTTSNVTLHVDLCTGVVEGYMCGVNITGSNSSVILSGTASYTVTGKGVNVMEHSS